MKLLSLSPLLDLLKEFPGTPNTSKAELKSLIENFREQSIKPNEELKRLRGIPKKFLKEEEITKQEENIKALEEKLALDEQIVALAKYLEPLFPDEDTTQNIYSLLLEADPTVLGTDAPFNQNIQAELFDYWLKQIRNSIQHEPNPITLLPLLEDQYGETPLKMACVITILLEQRLEPHSVSVNDIFQSGVLSRCFCIYTWTVNQKNELRQFYHWLENHRNESAVANLVAEAKHTLIPEEVKGTNPNLSLYGTPVENKDENNSPSKAIDPAQKKPFSFTETEENWETLKTHYGFSFLIHALKKEKPSIPLTIKYLLLKNDDILKLYEEILATTAREERHEKLHWFFYSIIPEQVLTIVESGRVLSWIAFNASTYQLSVELNENQLERVCDQPINPDELNILQACIQKERIPRKYHQKLIKGIIDCLLAAPNINNLVVNLEYLKKNEFSKEYCKQRYQELLADFSKEIETILSIDGLTVDAYIDIQGAWSRKTGLWTCLKELITLEQPYPKNTYDLQACILETLNHGSRLDIAASLEIFHPKEGYNYTEEDRETAKCRTLLACLKKNTLSSKILNFLNEEPTLKEKIFKIIISAINNDYVSQEWKDFLDCIARISPPELLETTLKSLPENQRLGVLKITKEYASETILETFISHNKDYIISLLTWLPEEIRLEALKFQREHHSTILEQLFPLSNFSYSAITILELLPKEQRLEALTLKHGRHPTVLAACIDSPKGHQIVLSMLELVPKEQLIEVLTFKREYHPTILETCICSFQGYQTALSMLKLLPQEQRLKVLTLKREYHSTILEQLIPSSSSNFSDRVVAILELLPEQERFELLKQCNASGFTILMKLTKNFGNLRDLVEVLKLLPQEDRLSALMEKSHSNQHILEMWICSSDSLAPIFELLTDKQQLAILAEKRTASQTYLDHWTSSEKWLPALLKSLSAANQLHVLTVKNSKNQMILDQENNIPLEVTLALLSEENQLKALMLPNSTGQTILDRLSKNPKLLPKVYFALTPQNRLTMFNNPNISKTVLSIMAANPPIKTAILNNTTGLEKSRLIILLAIEKYLQFRNTSSQGCGCMLTLFNPFSKGTTGLNRAKALKDKIIHAKEEGALAENVKKFLKGYTRFSSSSRYTDNSCASFLLAEFKNDPLLQEKFLSDIKLQFPEESKSVGASKPSRRK